MQKRKITTVDCLFVKGELGTDADGLPSPQGESGDTIIAQMLADAIANGEVKTDDMLDYIGITAGEFISRVLGEC